VVVATIAVIATVRAGSSGSEGSTNGSGLTPADASVRGIATPGEPAPAFDLPALRGSGRVQLSAYRGKPVIVNFWASYCIPCRKEFPLFRETQAKHRQDDLKIIGITFKDLPGDARRFADEHDATWHLANGGDRDPVGRAYGVRSPPQTFFIDRHGTIVSRFYGAPARTEFEAQVRKILAS
jgi:cytochrome c biogenesis protein CcmG, thiol:disulfide interchange protein DsbE